MAAVVTTSVRMPAPLAERVRELARDEERSFGAVVRLALREHLDHTRIQSDKPRTAP